MSKEDQPEAEEVLKHKFYVVKDSEGNYHVWGKTEYEKYINHAVRVAFKLVIGFNGDESYLFPAPQVNKAQEENDGGFADRESVRAPIENALYATNRLTPEQATELAEGILDYLLDENYWPVKIPSLDAGKERDNIQCKCSEDQKHGETSIMCCNHCGLPIEKFWT